MPNLSGSHNAFALVFSRSIKCYRLVRAEVAESPTNPRRDRIQDSRLVGVTSSRTTRLIMPTITVEAADAIRPAQARMSPPSRFGDKAFEWLTLAMAFAVVLLIILVGWQLWSGSLLAMKKFGVGFLVTSTWDPVAEHFGALPFSLRCRWESRPQRISRNSHLYGFGSHWFR